MNVEVSEDSDIEHRTSNVQVSEDSDIEREGTEGVIHLVRKLINIIDEKGGR